LLKACFRLKKNTEFKAVYNNHKSFASKNLVLYIGKNSKKEGPKIGFSVSSRIGNSVVRARTKRRLRAAAGGFVEKIKPDISLIFIARKPVLTIGYKELKRDMAWLLNRLCCFCEDETK